MYTEDDENVKLISIYHELKSNYHMEAKNFYLNVAYSVVRNLVTICFFMLFFSPILAKLFEIHMVYIFCVLIALFFLLFILTIWVGMQKTPTANKEISNMEINLINNNFEICNYSDNSNQLPDYKQITTPSIMEKQAKIDEMIQYGFVEEVKKLRREIKAEQYKIQLQNNCSKRYLFSPFLLFNSYEIRENIIYNDFIIYSSSTSSHDSDNFEGIAIEGKPRINNGFIKISTTYNLYTYVFNTGKLIKTNNKIINNHFRIYSNDSSVAFYYLNEDVLLELYELYEKHKVKFELYIDNNIYVILLYSPYKVFYPFDKNSIKIDRSKIKNDLKICNAMYDYLDVFNKIFRNREN